MRVGPMVLAALMAAASPAAAQMCDCGYEGAEVVVVPVARPRVAVEPATILSRETVLVPRTRLVPRTVYVPRTRLVPRTVYVARRRWVERAVVSPRVVVDEAPGYPAGYRYGATYVPPGTSAPCLLGTVGCDSSAVGPLDY